MVVAADKKIWTDEEFMALPDDGNKYELVNGELVVGNSGAKHGYITVILSAALFNVVRPQRLGVILDSSTAFNMKTGNKRSPDISFVSKDRLQGLQELPDGFLQGAPDLAIEVLSPNNTVEEIHNKIIEYFENDAKLVWVVNPQENYVLVYRSPEPDRLLKTTDNLDGEDVVPNFSFPVAELFQKLEF
ncbi:MAG: Uma2 family endonuclease [Aphanothece sp. CMT-3BRIN-NPC111]|jgi:Uma2 family endonuclease|nr:Uma2 family endonuclease [Aphanothece sp. CMT-3BRIN-NPC111]